MPTENAFYTSEKYFYLVTSVPAPEDSMDLVLSEEMDTQLTLGKLQASSSCPPWVKCPGTAPGAPWEAAAAPSPAEPAPSSAEPAPAGHCPGGSLGKDPAATECQHTHIPETSP